MMTRSSEARTKAGLVGLLWTGFDQFLSSLSNVLISLAIARASGSPGLGQYAAAFAVYLVVVGFQRSLISEPLLATTKTSGQASAKFALTTTLMFASAAGALTSLGGVITSSAMFMVLGPILPVVIGQDLIRYVLFRDHRPRAAALLDGLWVLASAIGFWVILRSGSPIIALAAWGTGGALSLVVGAATTGTRLASILDSFRWWKREARQLGGHLGAESIVYTIADGLATIGIAATLGARALGSLKATEIVLSPSTLALTALNLFLVPRLVRIGNFNGLRHAVEVSALGAFLGLVSVAGLVVVSPALSDLLYGGSIALERTLVLPLGARIIFSAGSVGIVALLKAQKQGRAIVVARIGWGVIGLPVVLILSALGGLVWAAWGFALQSACYTVLAWLGWFRVRQSASAEA